MSHDKSICRIIGSDRQVKSYPAWHRLLINDDYTVYGALYEGKVYRVVYGQGQDGDMSYGNEGGNELWVSQKGDLLSKRLKTSLTWSEVSQAMGDLPGFLASLKNPAPPEPSTGEQDEIATRLEQLEQQVGELLKAARQTKHADQAHSLEHQASYGQLRELGLRVAALEALFKAMGAKAKSPEPPESMLPDEHNNLIRPGTVATMKIGEGGWITIQDVEFDQGKQGWVRSQAEVSSTQDLNHVLYLRHGEAGYILSVTRGVPCFWTPGPLARADIKLHRVNW